MSKFKINNKYYKNDICLEILKRYKHFVIAKINEKIKQFHLCVFDNQEIIFTNEETFISSNNNIIYLDTRREI